MIFEMKMWSSLKMLKLEQPKKIFQLHADYTM